jgi:hypothetical protein
MLRTRQCALVVVGPKQWVAAFSDLAHLSTARPRASRKWSDTPVLSLRWAGHALNVRTDGALPRVRRAYVASLHETVHGLIRIEYRLELAGRLHNLKAFCRKLARAHPALSFVVASASENLSSARACVIRDKTIDPYELPKKSRDKHLRVARRRWGDDGKLSLDDAREHILASLAARWDAVLAVGSAYDPEAYEQTEYPIEITVHRRLVAIGPPTELEWLISYVRGPLLPREKWRGAWWGRHDVSFRAMAELLPRDVRPREMPADIPTAHLLGVRRRGSLYRACWALDVRKWWDDEKLEELLTRLSMRFRQFRYLLVWEDPDSFTAGSTFVRRGRMKRHHVPEVECKRIVNAAFRRCGVPLDTEDDDAALLASGEADAALLDRAEEYWARQLVQS